MCNHRATPQVTTNMDNLNELIGSVNAIRDSADRLSKNLEGSAPATTAVELRTPTRAQYMANEVTHDEYYLAVANTAGLAIPRHSAGTPGALQAMLPRVKAALKAGDNHLNTIDLKWWDEQAEMRRRVLGWALKAHGDGYSLAGGVCVLKALMRATALGKV